MIKVKVKANAKINLYLDILEKRTDNYHELKTIMTEINVYDNLIFCVMKSDDSSYQNININTNSKFVPTDNKNICYKIIYYIKKAFDIKDTINLFIEKHIPVGAGLGGGSSDGASTLIFLNNYYKLNLSKKELMDILNLYGSDTAFFVEGGTCLCEGRGEIITKLNNFDNNKIKIFFPNMFVSTKLIFDMYDNLIDFPDIKNTIETLKQNKSLDNMIDAINKNDMSKIVENSFNVLEPITLYKYKKLSYYKEQISSNDFLITQMSGSGPTFFSIIK